MCINKKASKILVDINKCLKNKKDNLINCNMKNTPVSWSCLPSEAGVYLPSFIARKMCL